MLGWNNVRSAGGAVFSKLFNRAFKRGFRAKGGEPDYDKAAATLLQDYRSGRLGRISLETPSSREVKTQAYAHARLMQQEAEKVENGE